MKKVLMLCAVVAFALGCTKSGLEISNNKSLKVSCDFASFDGLDGFEKPEDQASSEKSKSPEGLDSRLTDTAFEVEDEIGIYVHTDLAVQNPPAGNHSSNMRYIFKGENIWQSSSSLSGELIQPAYNATGYYPYKGIIANPHAVAHSVESDQSTHRAMSKSDFARAVAALVNPNSDSPTLNFSGANSFKHLMSKLRVSAFIPTEVDDVAVESIASVVIGGLKSDCTVNLADGVVTLNTSAVATEIVAREVVKGGAGEYSEWEAIVVPQSVALGVDLVTITLNMVGGSTKELKYTIESGEAFSDLKSGTRVTLTLGNSADLAFADIAELSLADGLASSGKFSVKAPSGTAWSVASSQTWLTLSNNSNIAGDGTPQEVTFAIALNSTEKIRTAILTLSATINGKVESITHTITQNYYVLGVASSMNIDAKVLSTPILPFTSNQVWTATITATDGGAAPDWLKLSTSATAGTTPLVAYTHTGNLAANKLFYHTTINEGDGRSAKIVFSNSITPNLAEQIVTQDTDVPYVTIGGLKWTTGNLVADGANGCKPGAPTDYGLYFQWGKLVGWSGGASGDGTGIASTSPTLVAKVKPLGYTGSSSWGSAYTNQGSYTTINVATGWGDPCKHYLGGTWRTPTTAEYATLTGKSGSDWIAWNAGIIGKWSSSPKGGWFGPGLLSNGGTPDQSKHIFFPVSGYRLGSSGSFDYVGTNGYCWSSSVYTVANGYNLKLHQSSGVIPQNSSGRSFGFPVRCVSSPPPALTISKSSPGETVHGGGKVYTIGVTSNTSWSAKNLSGVTVSPTSGSSGTTSVTITVAATTLSSTRTVKCDFVTTSSDGQTNLTKTWSGTQAAIPPPPAGPPSVWEPRTGLHWATGNLTTSGTIGSPTSNGGYYTWSTAKTKCQGLGGKWRLPTTYEQMKLCNNVGNGSSYSSAGFSLSGSTVTHSTVPSLTFATGDYYWSGTEDRSNTGYLLFFYANYVHPQSDSYKTDTLSVRCVSE